MKLISYVIPYDYGFAPNPYFGYLTLATCKPKIRTYAKVGDVLIGTGSKNGIGSDKLVYVGIISEIINTNDYFNDERFQRKKPAGNLSPEAGRGDNIYYQDEYGEWQQLPNKFHNIEELKHDISSTNVIVCEEYWYFGNEAPIIPANLTSIIKRGHSRKYIYDEEIISEFIAWINTFSKGIQGKPSSLYKQLLKVEK